MIETAIDPVLADQETEAYRVLLGQLGRRTSSIPQGVLVRHVLETVPAHEWPVRVEALEAIWRRLDSGHKDELRIETRPEQGRVLGVYAHAAAGLGSAAVSHRGFGRRPDPGQVRLSRLSQELTGPVQAHSDHPGKPVCATAIAQTGVQGTTSTGKHVVEWPGLGPDPAAARLWRLAGTGGLGRHAMGQSRPGARAAQAMAWFRPGNNGSLILKKTYRDEPARRLELVESLLKVVPAKPRSVRHDPALRAMLVHERGKLKRIIETTLWPSEQKAALKGLKCPLYPYQRDGVEAVSRDGQALAGGRHGAGKDGPGDRLLRCSLAHRTGSSAA